jgi:DnaJ-domain-containing protein 1
MVDTVRAKGIPGSSEGSRASTLDGTESNGTSSDGTGGARTADGRADQSHTKPTVPEEAVASDPYQRLGLLPGASSAEVKRAWRTRSRQAHPDAPGGEAEDFMSLKSAYEQIMEQRKVNPEGP